MEHAQDAIAQAFILQIKGKHHHSPLQGLGDEERDLFGKLEGDGLGDYSLAQQASRR